MERIIIKSKKIASVSLALLICLLLGILIGCDDIPMRLTIDDLSTRDPEWLFMYKIEAPEGSDNVDFGTSVSISGDYIIIGDENCYDYEGRAYVYKRNGDTWDLDETLSPTGIDPYSFGYSVDIWGTQAVCGAHYESGGGTLRGAVYIYELVAQTWSEEYHYASLNNDDWLGYSVGVAADIVVVGVPNYDETFSNQGIVRVLTKSGGEWIFSDTIYAADPHDNDHFGKAVDVYEDYMIVGTPDFDEGANADAGKVYIYEYDGNNWYEETIPSFAESLVAGNKLGKCVSLFDTNAFAGAPDESPFTAVYSRQGDDWNKYTLPAGGEDFASAVGVSDEFAVIGAPGENTNTGEIYIYQRSDSTWGQFGDPITADDGETDNFFGCAVAISGNYCVIGAEGHGTDNEGAVYVYEYTVYETPE